MTLFLYSSNSYQLQHTTTGPRGFAPAPTQLPAEAQFVRFFNATTGIVAARLSSGATSWPVYRTTDGGSTWQQVTNLPAAVAGAVPAAVLRLGAHLWLSYAPGWLLHTPDAGQTWTVSATPEVLSRLSFRDAQHGLAMGPASNSNPLYRTSDGGATWSLVNATGLRRRFAMAAVPGSAGTFISVGVGAGYQNPGDSPGTAVSFDEGQTWRDYGGMEWMVNVAADATGRLWASTYNSASYFRYAGAPLASAAPQSVSGTVYPNPTTGWVNLPATGHRQAVVTDAAGRQVLACPLAPGQTSLDLRGLPAGLYQLRLDGGSSAPLQQRVMLAR